MKLFYCPGTISIAVCLALFEAGNDFDAIKVDFASGEQTKPAYHAINPKGRVPALVLENGDVLTETGAILEYVAALAPERALVPGDPLQAARMREVMFYLASTMHVNHAHKMRGHRWADLPESHADMTAKVSETMGQSAAYINENALSGPFVLGDQMTVADCYLYVVCNWLEGDGVDTAPFENITRFMTTMDSRASLQRARDNGMI